MFTLQSLYIEVIQRLSDSDSDSVQHLPPHSNKGNAVRLGVYLQLFRPLLSDIDEVVHRLLRETSVDQSRV